MLGVIDPETGRVLHVQTNSAALRDRYVTAAAERHAAIGASVRGAGADHLVLSTDRDWVLDMARFLTRRTPNRTALSSVSAHPSSGSRDPGRVTP
jgi:uncharacterized protein (DUF58 family)